MLPEVSLHSRALKGIPTGHNDCVQSSQANTSISYLIALRGHFDMNSIVNSNSDIATVKEVSEYLRVHASTVYRLLARKKLPAFRVGSDWRFSLSAIDQWRKDAETGNVERVVSPKV
jgi:excisionase family DNA binding protein